MSDDGKISPKTQIARDRMGATASVRVPLLQREESRPIRFEVRLEQKMITQSEGHGQQLERPSDLVTEKGKEISVTGVAKQPGRYFLPHAASLSDVWRISGGPIGAWIRKIFVSSPEGYRSRLREIRIIWSRRPETEAEWALLVESLAVVDVPPGSIVFFVEESV